MLLVNPSRVPYCSVLMYSEQFEGPELCAWEAATPGERCESHAGVAAQYIARDLSAVGTHGDIGMCAECWEAYTNPTGPTAALADHVVIYRKVLR
jgi:hypothetical protein